MVKVEKRVSTDEQPPRPSTRDRLLRYGPLAVWAVLIFIGSGNVLSAEHTSSLLTVLKRLFPSASQEFLNLVHFLIRKGGHLTEYAILASLAAHAFRHSFHSLLRRRWFSFSLALAMLYALTDEFHQSFVPTRTASIYDSMIDSAGALLALTVIWLWRRKARNRVRSGSISDRITMQPAKSYES